MKEAFKHIGWFFKQEYKRYIYVAIILLILSITPVLPGKFLGIAIDEIVSATLTIETLIFLGLALMVVPVVRYVMNITYHYSINSLGHGL